MSKTQSPSTQFVDVDNYRINEQKIEMEKIAAAGHCPFCPDQLKIYHKQGNEFEGKYWIITKNQWPYEHTRHHYLAILKTHKDLLSQLTAAEGSELIQLMGKLESSLIAPGGAIAMRFGDTAYSAGTVRHLHAQFIVPEINDQDFEPTRIKIGKSRK